tara:strand:- start:423 stop:1208 length:786 start_codon:yes stop_codon:yes gene_type:complete
MFYKKKGLPEDSELVLCTVKKILYHSVFVSLDEYDNLEGMIHISEISPGRIRNIRDFVKEGKKIVCKVLKINKEKKHIDLSLRRVSPSLRKKRSEESKQEQRAEKILELAGNKLKIKLDQMYKDVGEILMEEFGSLYKAFLAILQDEKSIDDVKIPKKYSEIIIETVKENIKPPEVIRTARLMLRSFSDNGIEVIKNSIKKTQEFAKKKNYKVHLSYISAPHYKISINAEDYKSAEKILDEVANIAIKEIKENKGVAELIK